MPADQLTVAAVIANAAGGMPDGVAAVVDGAPLTFRELANLGDASAHRLRAASLAPGSVALVVGPTSPQMLGHFVGCSQTGIVFVPIDPRAHPDSVRAVCERISPAVMLAAPEHAHLADLAEVPCWWDGEAGDDDAPAGDAEPWEPAAGDPHVAFLTSGSSGTPKAALLSNATSVLRSHPGAQLEPRGPALCPYPLFHMAGWTIALQQWHARAPIVFSRQVDPASLLDDLAAFDIARFNAIPALWARLSEHLGPDAPGALPSLRFADTGTSPTSPALLRQIVEMAPNAHVRVFYGSTEAGNVASLHHDDLLSRPGRCGRPSVLTEVSIADDGELLIRGPLLFDGYLGDDEKTAESLRGGWFHSGDRAEFDDDGYLSIVGRLGSVIRTGGESVDPGEVEQVLREHPAVDDVAVIGTANDAWGEIVVAVVVAEEIPTTGELAALLEDHPRHYRPRRVVGVDEIPRTAATGQVDRRRLHAMVEEAPDPTSNDAEDSP